jgi:RNase H-fold protein (predicted Holliday junction resolvase)
MINELGSSNKKVVINTVELLKQVSKENKVLQSKVKTYEQDINKRYNVPIVKTDETVNEIMEDVLSIEDPQAIK